MLCDLAVQCYSLEYWLYKNEAGKSVITLFCFKFQSELFFFPLVFFTQYQTNQCLLLAQNFVM